MIQMTLFKKIIFALPFLIFFSLTIFFFKSILTNPTQVLSLDLSSFYQILIFNSFLILTALFFCLFVSFARSWQLVIPVIMVSLVTIFTLFPSLNSPSIFLIVGLLITESIIFFLLDNNLNNYITFSSTQIYSPHIKRFSQLAAIIFSISLFVFFNIHYQTNKFEIPDSLIDTALKSVPQNITTSDAGESISLPSRLNITPEQIQTLKQNPKVLEQFGLSVSDLEKLSNPTTIQTKNSKKQVPLDQMLIRTAVKNQVNQMIEPYRDFIPLALAFLFFLSLYSINSLLLILISPILFLIFKVLEGTKFITFTKEMREIKKMVI